MRKFIDSKHVRRLGILLCILLSLFGVLFTQFNIAANSKTPFKEALLEFIPMRSPIATYVNLKHGGDTDFIRYIRSRQLVVEVFNGKLSEQLTNQIFTSLNQVLEETLHIQTYTGDGLTQGDQFHLVFAGEDRTPVRIFGFTHLAPKSVSPTVNELLGVVKHLKKTPLAGAYLKSELISKERFTRLQSSGLVKNFEEFPAKLREILQSVTDRPYKFVALNNTQYRNFLTAKVSSELLLNKQGIGYQIEVFTINKKNQ